MGMIEGSWGTECELSDRFSTLARRAGWGVYSASVI